MARGPGRGPERLITLTSDVGATYAAQMKAVLVRFLGPDRIVDLSHELRPYAVEEAAFLVRAMTRGFPTGTVHLVVVDPGVGGTRAGIAIECADGTYLVGPDNGVLYPLAEELGIRRTVRLDRSRISVRDRVGTTFDGRDLFAFAAARLAMGVPLSRLGADHRPHVFRLPDATLHRYGAKGVVLHVDRFGNLITNVPTEWVPKGTTRLELRVDRGRSRAVPLGMSYEGIGVGRLGAIGSSFGLLELAVGRGNAATRVAAHLGSTVRVRWRSGAGAEMMVNSEGSRRR